MLLYHTKKSKWLTDLNISQDTIKFLEENISKTFSNISHTDVFSGQSPKTIKKKIKNKQMGPHQAYKLLHSKGNHKENEKTTYGLGKNICKWCECTSKIYKQQIQFDNNNNKSQTTQSKNGQKIQLDISPKKTYRWPIGTWKDAHHC